MRIFEKFRIFAARFKTQIIKSTTHCFWNGRTTTPTYTFSAKTTDYESRFKLVFASTICEDTNGDNAFAFISDGNIVVNGEGVLQVIDMTGRVIGTVDGRTRCVPTDAMTPGVYVLRLINGNDVKTQKMVVE